MANSFAHAAVGGAVGVAAAVIDREALEENPLLLLAASFVGTAFGKLPDIIEPAFRNPNHRQFFHSIAILGAVGYGLKKVYDREPQDGLEKAIRMLVLCAGAGYLSHLLLDASTPRGLPLLGKF